MNRNLSVERTYALRQYENIKLYDSITDIPDEILLDKELMAQIRFIQFLSLESAYRGYIKLMEKLSPYNLQESIEVLEEVQINSFEELKNKLLEKGE